MLFLCWGITNPPVLIGRTFFTADCKSAGTPGGFMLVETTWEFLLGVFQEVSPLGVPPDLQSGVKKCPNLLMLCGFGIRSKQECYYLGWGITNPPVLIGRTFFYGGFQIRRDA